MQMYRSAEREAWIVAAVGKREPGKAVESKTQHEKLALKLESTIYNLIKCKTGEHHLSFDQM